MMSKRWVGKGIGNWVLDVGQKYRECGVSFLRPRILAEIFLSFFFFLGKKDSYRGEKFFWGKMDSI